MILEVKRIKVKYKPLVIFLIFQVVCMAVMLPFQIFYGPFKNVKLSVIENSYRSSYYQKIVQIFIPSDKMAALAKESDLNINFGTEAAGKSTNVAISTNQTSGTSTVKNINNTSSNAQSIIPDSELRKLTGQVINKKNGSLIYQIIVSIEQQKVYIYDNRDGKLVKEFVCSTGLPGDDTETVKGKFTVATRGEFFYNEKYQEGAYYWTQFFGNYLFHSVPFDVNRNIEKEEAEKLGQPASHGCVRLQTENAKWIYDNIPTGTEVIVE